mgnify:CR=1 FL=1
MNRSFALLPRSIFIIALTLGLAACGFHLRGLSPLPSALTQINLLSNSGSNSFDRALNNALIRAGVSVSQQGDQDNTRLELKINPLQSRDTTLSVTSDNDISQLERQLSTVYFIRNKEGKALFGPRTISTTQTLSNQNAEESTKAAYNASAMEAMAEQLAQQLVYDLAYAPL